MPNGQANVYRLKQNGKKAARGRLIGKKYPWGNAIDSNKANYNKNTKSGKHNEQTTPIGKYAANEYGLFDMSGNVAEWCLDAYQKDFYANSPQTQPYCWRRKHQSDN